MSRRTTNNIVAGVVLFGVGVVVGFLADHLRRPEHHEGELKTYSVTVRSDPELSYPSTHEDVGAGAVFTFRDAQDAKDASAGAFQGAAVVYEKAHREK